MYIIDSSLWKGFILRRTLILISGYILTLIVIEIFFPYLVFEVRTGSKNHFLPVFNNSSFNDLNYKQEGSSDSLNSNIVFQYQKKFKNSNIVATLTFINTGMEFIITQSSDNSYYLTHDLYSNNNILGNPFLDFRVGLRDRKLIIYGHNSKMLNAPFHILEKYLDYDYMQKHALLILDDGRIKSSYQIFSVFVVKDDYQHMKLQFSKDEYLRHLNWLKSHSIYDTGVEVGDSDDILILQTCYYQPKDSYLLVVGKRISVGNP